MEGAEAAMVTHQLSGTRPTCWHSADQFYFSIEAKLFLIPAGNKNRGRGGSYIRFQFPTDLASVKIHEFPPLIGISRFTAAILFSMHF